MAVILKSIARSNPLPPGKPKFPDNVPPVKEGDGVLSGLVQLIGPNSWTIPNLLDLFEDDMAWLALDVHQWSLIPGYRQFVKFVLTLSVSNDSAERGIKLVQDFVNSSTDEKLHQDLMLAVSDHRKQLKK